MDMVLLVDGSAAVTAFGTSETRNSEFYRNYVFSFLKNLIDNFDVDEDAVHVGLIFYGNPDIGAVKNEVNEIFDSSRTRIFE